MQGFESSGISFSDVGCLFTQVVLRPFSGVSLWGCAIGGSGVEPGSEPAEIIAAYSVHSGN